MNAPPPDNLPPSAKLGIQRSLFQRAGYAAIRALSRLSGLLLFRLRVEGGENFPSSGAALVCSNHQSYFDPILVGVTCSRRMNYLARDSLFRVPVLKHLIHFLDAIPIDREGSGIAGIKETLKRLKARELVLIFPEGTRTNSGDVLPLKAGFCAVARRSKVPLIPVGLDGAFQAWPRTSLFPSISRMAVVVGAAIDPAVMDRLTDEELVRLLEQRIRTCHSRARFLRSR